MNIFLLTLHIFWAILSYDSKLWGPVPQRKEKEN